MISKCPMCVNNADGLLDSTPISDKEFIELIVTEKVELRGNLLAMIVNIIQEGNLK